MATDERHAGEEGVIRSDIAETIDRAAAMAIYAFNAIVQAAQKSAHDVPDGLGDRVAESTFTDILRYSLEECSCSCHQEHPP